ncbi:hypothetical protein EVAR_48579_1 [Eumeta japonica]|uniref:DNA helicase Pif1-like 2B domain-containing protein n=1 Tax=Eumeta variegata TaxID=151549 RepID=A0A4C1XDB3_EUMVA|nr:hypothetical protein EVAR_48579_1 [Eumeta japonica]
MRLEQIKSESVTGDVLQEMQEQSRDPQSDSFERAVLRIEVSKHVRFRECLAARHSQKSGKAIHISRPHFISAKQIRTCEPHLGIYRSRDLTNTLFWFSELDIWSLRVSDTRFAFNRDPSAYECEVLMYETVYYQRRDSAVPSQYVIADSIPLPALDQVEVRLTIDNVKTTNRQYSSQRRIHVAYSTDSLELKVTRPLNSLKIFTDDVANYPTEFLNSLACPGLPPHNLQLKVGSVTIMLRNINQPRLCNGIRLAVKKMMNNSDACISDERACESQLRSTSPLKFTLSSEDHESHTIPKKYWTFLENVQYVLDFRGAISAVRRILKLKPMCVLCEPSVTCKGLRYSERHFHLTEDPRKPILVRCRLLDEGGAPGEIVCMLVSFNYSIRYNPE